MLFIKSSPYYTQKLYSKFIKLSFYLLLFSLSILFCSFLFPYYFCSSVFYSFITVSLLYPVFYSFITVSLLYPVFCFFCYSVFILLCPCFPVLFLFNLYISLVFLANSKILLYLCVVNELAMTYQTTMAQQRNFNFFAFFSALYLVVSDILLTHTHTHRRN